MVEWTQSAREALNHYLDRMRTSASQSGADPEEVIDDLKRHIDEDVASAGLAIVTQNDLDRILSRMGSPPIEEAIQPGPNPNAEPAPEAHGVSRSFSILCAAFGILLPAFTLGLEVSSGMCAGVFFDPIPTIWHALLVGFVPLAHFLGCLALWRRNGTYRRGLLRMNAVAIGISLYYALVFLPLSPFAVVGVLYFGLGLVPLSPLLALLVGLVIRSALKRLPSTPGTADPSIWKYIGLVAGIILLLHGPKLLTVAGLRAANSPNAERRADGVRFLRTYGSDDMLLRLCYARDRLILDGESFFFGWLRAPVSRADIRGTYYRVTGNPYNAVKPPTISGLRTRNVVNTGEFDFDQGGDAVAARVRDLWLHASRIDTRIDPDSGVAYTEWTLVFKNDSSRQREARAQLALPPGSVVSRLTLWIDGEEREAAFGGRERTKTAYQRVVQRRRDPVLVTTSGPDQVLLQCFPVPPEGGIMKARIGITSPLHLESPGSTLLRLPYFQEQNFGFAQETHHTIWIESAQPLQPPADMTALVVEHPEPDLYAVRGDLTDEDLAGGFAVRAERDAAVTQSWSDDLRLNEKGFVRQRIEARPTRRPERLVIVVDGSRRMNRQYDAVAEALGHLPAGLECGVLMASDDVVEVLPVQPWSIDSRAVVAKAMSRHHVDGGCDNVPALLKAWDLVADRSPSAILWLHATQPIELAHIEALKQKWERRPSNPLLYDLQFGRGPNRVLEELNGLPAVRRVPALGDFSQDIARLFSLWSGETEPILFTRELVPDQVDRPKAPEGSSHIARLWAFDEVKRRAGTGKQPDTDSAVRMAVAYQLVTPVSGAVVLETAEQYDQAGLKPGEASDSPRVVPEPGTWAMLVTASLLFTWWGWRTRRRGPATARRESAA